MDILLVGACVVFVVWLYFKTNPMAHSSGFMWRRFFNWFPLGMSYAFLYMARYNLNVTKNALGSAMSNDQFGLIFGAGTIVYGCSFLIVGPLVDRIGGRKGMLISTIGASLMNIVMGVFTYLYLNQMVSVNMTLTFAILYSMNMFFQSFGGVSIIKVKAYWFHVRERGTFGAIFGTLISFGLYFAFDWGQQIANAAQRHVNGPRTGLSKLFATLFAVDTGKTDAVWLVFFVPAALLLVWAAIDFLLIRDTPLDAGFDDFDTHDASSGEMDKTFSASDLLKRIFTSPILLTIAFVEFTNGVVRNGIVQWYFVFAHQKTQTGAQFFSDHWGLLLCLTGVAAGFLGGYMSDRLFQSRRGPPVVILGTTSLIFLGVMSAVLFTAPIAVGTAAVIISMTSIGIHALMSGTAAADFGGRKATATASGITDGFVYLGSGLQSVCIGYLTTKSWAFWPMFLIPFAVGAILLAMKMWRELPAATRRYLMTVEKITVLETADQVVVTDEIVRSQIETART